MKSLTLPKEFERTTPTIKNSPVLRSIETAKRRKEALTEAQAAIELAVMEALGSVPTGSTVPDWLDRLDRAGKAAAFALNCDT